MAEVRWTVQAARDLESIIDFIAKDSAQYAGLFAADVFQAVERVAKFPQAGRVVPELREPRVREVLIGSYRLVYRLKARRISQFGSGSEKSVEDFGIADNVRPHPHECRAPENQGPLARASSVSPQQVTNTPAHRLHRIRSCRKAKFWTRPTRSIEADAAQEFPDHRSNSLRAAFRLCQDLETIDSFIEPQACRQIECASDQSIYLLADLAAFERPMRSISLDLEF